MTKERFLAITDGIIAIIATIMVLEFHVPKSPDLAGLAELAIPMFVYLNSFLLIMGVWFNHHHLFKDIKRISPRTFFLNVIWLFFMSLIPFATSWAGQAPTKILPELFYLFIITLWTFGFIMMHREIRIHNKDVEFERMTHTYPAAVLFSLDAICLILVWFWPPIVLLVCFGLSVSVQIQFIRNVGFKEK